ncbi:DUF1810 domain-containing protein [Tsuneonella sp. YG55]|uniref:DUF1810 domain-containing protein n=1 Tax=Tsuneonella litorea TaxID=2976475 RepID=A0A9X2W0S9_9SPHN|nr:DUF1810 domain-containing protein [Tsuneonella litorea]MCT2558508.1 DUF1810 domain-containing protein [Tsuneonella litorea]
MTGLRRFLDAQEGGVYETALDELRAGAKRSHWMWFVFPQIAGLGRSDLAHRYAIEGKDEAAAYARHHVLGSRLAACTDAMLSWRGKRSAEAILGPADARKFHSSMTLFAACAPDPAAFAGALDAFYAGQRDPATMERL